MKELSALECDSNKEAKDISVARPPSFKGRLFESSRFLIMRSIFNFKVRDWKLTHLISV